MRIVRIAKLIATTILLVCIFLPLSQCRGAVEEGAQGGPELYDNYIYGQNLLLGNLESLFAVCSWVLPFILALAVFKFGASIKLSLSQVVASVFAAFSLFGTVLFSHQILWAAYLAAASIILFAVLALLELWLLVRQWHP